MDTSHANTLIERALDACKCKRFADAEELWSTAGKLYAKAEQWIGVATCHLNRGNALAKLGRFAESIA